VRFTEILRLKLHRIVFPTENKKLKAALNFEYTVPNSKQSKFKTHKLSRM
jgi:hypothetical protein